MSKIKSIKTIFALTMVIMTIIVFSLQTGFSHYQFSRILEEKIVELLKTQGRNEATRLNTNFIVTSKVVESQAETMEALSISNADAILGIMKLMMAREPLIIGGGFWLEPFVHSEQEKYYAPYLFRSGVGGEYHLTWEYSNEKHDYFQSDWYKKALKPGVRVAWSEPYIDAISGVIMITASSPIKKDGNVIGVTSVDIGLEELIHHINEMEVGNSGYGFLVSSRGAPLANLATEYSRIEDTEENVTSLKNIASIVLDKDQTGMMETILNGQEVLVVATPVGDTGLRLVMVMPVREAFASVRWILTQNMIVLICSILLLAVMIFQLFESKVVVPLQRLNFHAARIGSGDFDHVIDVKTQDEIGQLCMTFNTMSATIRENMKAINNSNQALRLSEERWHLALSGSNDGIWDWNIKTGTIFFSSRAKEMFGYDDTTMPRNIDEWMEILPFDEREIVHELIEKHFAKETDFFSAEHRVRCLDGTFKWAFGRGQALWEGDKPVRIVGSLSDITQRKNGEEALRQAYDQLETKVELRTQDLLAINQELQSVNQESAQNLEQLKQAQTYLVESEKMASLGNLVAGIAHEINTPIGVSVTAVSHLQVITKEFNELYESGNLSRKGLTDYLAESDEAATIIFSNLERASQLIRSFKQVSVDQSNETMRIFNVKKYLGEVLLSLQPKLKRTHYKINVECDEELEIYSFPGAFAQIITNLIMNSLMHAYEPDDIGEITIRIIIEKDETVHLTYSDDGQGMEDIVLEKIFNPFFTTKRGMGGTGLGLSVLYNIVTQQFGGTIECVSELSKGTTFIIDFPLKKEEDRKSN
ncbi:ATP-binding protein [Pelosinus sp. sgz500959]|uniref:PDC sensor domain-containing protein n=1 Tax=Pelosinus sp. sgz500959 TaxID=3242472 RepID=UPI003671F985